nr:putative integron gene cassette protein [uncultured bacterium]
MSDAHCVDVEKRLLAVALFELKVLLSGHLDPDERSPASDAAWFAYALHNQALATLDGQPFDVARALEAIDRLEPRLGERYLQRFRKTVLSEA